jgi:TAT-translocated FGD2 family F420-dependent dehydrogenase
MGSKGFSVGFVLSHEQFPATQLLEFGVAAERAGFDSLWVSDHFHPWQDNQGHAGHAWVTLGALSQRTNRIIMGTGVTCPTYRFRPADVAQAFASLGVLSPRRIFLGVGTGEALNELPSGGGWGPHKERLDRLAEAVTLIRRLWNEDWVSAEGTYFQVKNAKIYDKPLHQVPIYIAGIGPRSARLAATAGDGWITHPEALLEPEHEQLLNSFHDSYSSMHHDGTPRIVVEQFTVVGDQEDAIEGARLWQFLAIVRQLFDEPDPRRIQELAETRSTPALAAKRFLISPDPAVHVDRLRRLRAAGATDVFIHCPQMDQHAAISFYGDSVLPEL